MNVRKLTKMQGINDGPQSLFESVMIPKLSSSRIGRGLAVVLIRSLAWSFIEAPAHTGDRVPFSGRANAFPPDGVLEQDVLSENGRRRGSSGLDIPGMRHEPPEVMAQSARDEPAVRATTISELPVPSCPAFETGAE